MTTTRLVAAVFAAVSLVAPAAFAEDSPETEPEATIVETTRVDAQTPDPPAEGRVVRAIVTGYATGGEGGRVGAMTASGVATHWGTVAADWRLYPLGTRLQIEGFPDMVFTVEDRGGGVRGNIFDVWFPDLATAIAFGTQRRAVTILP